MHDYQKTQDPNVGDRDTNSEQVRSWLATQDEIDWIIIINANDDSILLGQNFMQFIPESPRG